MLLNCLGIRIPPQVRLVKDREPIPAARTIGKVT